MAFAASAQRVLANPVTRFVDHGRYLVKITGCNDCHTPGEGANPVEFLLHALAGCVTTTFVLHAARGIRIRELATELDGDLDLHGRWA